MGVKIFTKRTIKFLAVIVICLGLVIFNPSGFFSPVRALVLKLAYPFQKTFYLVGQSTGKYLGLVGSFWEVKKENDRLVKENYFLQSEITVLKEQKKENETLRNQLGLIPREKFNLEASFVIGQDQQGFGNWVMIDKGAAAGIRTGMPVIISQGVLVGRVEDVFSDSSRVILLSHAESAVNAFDLETGAKGILKGEYGLGVVLDLISQKEVLNVGDSVLSSGLGGNFPKGLFLGKIQEIRVSSDKLFQQAVINLGAKPQSLEVVFVIKN